MIDMYEFFWKRHKEAVENWKEGEPVRTWQDDDGAFCIEYESGRWWHYVKVNGSVEWW